MLFPVPLIIIYPIGILFNRTHLFIHFRKKNTVCDVCGLRSPFEPTTVLCITPVDSASMQELVLQGHKQKWHWLSWLYLFSIKWLVYGKLFLHISTSLWSTDYLYEKRIGQVTSDLLSMGFTYYTKNIQQGCSRPSNWFSLRCLGPWKNYLPPV